MKVKGGKVASVKVIDEKLGTYSIVKLRAPIEAAQLRGIKPTLEKFFDIAREVVPAARIKARRKLVKKKTQERRF